MPPKGKSHEPRSMRLMLHASASLGGWGRRFFAQVSREWGQSIDCSLFILLRYCDLISLRLKVTLKRNRPQDDPATRLRNCFVCAPKLRTLYGCSLHTLPYSKCVCGCHSCCSAPSYTFPKHYILHAQCTCQPSPQGLRCKSLG